MGNLIDLNTKHTSKLNEECEILSTSLKEIELSCGIVRNRGRGFILQGAFLRIREFEQGLMNLNHFHYLVDNSLIIDGWNPIGFIPFDEKYFLERRNLLSLLSDTSNVREEWSEDRYTGKRGRSFYYK